MKGWLCGDAIIGQHFTFTVFAAPCFLHRTKMCFQSMLYRWIHTYVLSKIIHSKCPKMKNRDCNVLDVIFSLGREEIHPRRGNGTTMKPQETQKAVLQSCISGVKFQLGKHLGSILLRRACIAGQISLIFLFHTDKSTTYKKTEIKSPNIPKYIQGEIANDIYSCLWHIPCTFSMDKLGMELWWKTGMKYRIVEIKQRKGWMFLHLDFLVIPKKSAGLKQCPRAVVLICSQSTSSWVIDSSLACSLHVTHISPFPSEPLTGYINAEYQDKQAGAQSALVPQAKA